MDPEAASLIGPSDRAWYEAVEFCNWLSDNERLEACYTGFREEIRWNRSCDGCRLPTKAEWTMNRL